MRKFQAFHASPQEGDSEVTKKMRVKQQMAKGIDKFVDITKDENLKSQLELIDLKFKTLNEFNTNYDPKFGFHKPTTLQKKPLAMVGSSKQVDILRDIVKKESSQELNEYMFKNH